nr:hypothetical protein [Tanacetum cinerariifolium]
MEAIRFTNTSVDEIGIDDSSRYPLDELQEDNPSRQYQVDYTVSYYIIPHGEEVYVKQHPGFKSSEFPDYVCKLDKSLYGLRQAPRAWEVFLGQVYVDDIIFGSTSYKLCKQFVKLMKKNFEMSMMGELTYFLGLQLKQDDKRISICQELYTMNLVKKYEISNSSLVKTSMVPPNNLALCARYQSNLKESDLTAVKRILMYLKGTLTIGLYYPKCSCFDLKGYSDLDYDGCNMDRKSTSGACQIHGGKLVCWSAKKQQSVAMSSAEAEYVVDARNSPRGYLEESLIPISSTKQFAKDRKNCMVKKKKEEHSFLLLNRYGYSTKGQKQSKIGQNQALEWKEFKKLKPKANLS